MSWDETGYGAPETYHAPVVHAMSHSIFNGVLNVFIFGNDGYIHHIWQTTCDKVPNPWGWCTWSVWYKTSDKIPETVSSNNPLSIGANIHLGIEVERSLCCFLGCYSGMHIGFDKYMHHSFPVTHLHHKFLHSGSFSVLQTLRSPNNIKQKIQ